MAKVSFDKTLFATQFPGISLKGVHDFTLARLWATAESFVDNTETSQVPYNPKENVYTRQLLLYYAMAHLLRLELTPTGLPGRITSATEGSVTISVESYKADSLSAQWWSQTPEGMCFWQLSSPYRMGTRVYLYKEAHPWG